MSDYVNTFNTCIFENKYKSEDELYWNTKRYL